jgi:hypothetical protein
MRRILVVLIGLLSAVAGTSGSPALAGSAHFTYHQISILDDQPFHPQGTLRLQYREEGVDPNQLVNYTALAAGTFEWLCVRSRETRTVFQRVSTEVRQLPFPYHSTIDTSVYLPLPPSPFNPGECPLGPTVVGEVTYDNALLCDTDHAVCQRFHRVHRRFTIN